MHPQIAMDARAGNAYKSAQVDGGPDGIGRTAVGALVVARHCLNRFHVLRVLLRHLHRCGATRRRLKRKDGGKNISQGDEVVSQNSNAYSGFVACVCGERDVDLFVDGLDPHVVFGLRASLKAPAGAPHADDGEEEAFAKTGGGGGGGGGGGADGDGERE